MKRLIRYFSSLKLGKLVLWCYFIWYLVILAFYFDPTISIWLNSLGLSLIIGIGLNLSISKLANTPADQWQTFRLFFMPFCVSSFATLIKNQGFILIFPGDFKVTTIAILSCSSFILMVFLLKLLLRSQPLINY